MTPPRGFVTLVTWTLLAMPGASQTVEGTVFLDADRDGVQDPGELALPGLNITVFGEGGNTDQSTTSLADGSWSFALINNFPYVLEVAATGLRLSYQDLGGDPHPIPDWPKGRRRPGLLGQLVGNLRAATAGMPLLHVGIGDSIAYGFNLCDSPGGGKGYLPPLTTRLDQSSQGASLDNLAVLGQDTFDLLDPAASGNVFDVVNRNPDLVTISIGGNDYLDKDGNEAGTAANLVAARQNLQEVLSTILSQLPNTDVILNTVYDNEGGDDAFHNRWGPIWNQTLRDVAWGQSRRVGIAEVWPDYEHEDPATGVKLGQEDLICGFFLDRIHPTGAGYDLHEEKIWQGMGGVQVSDPTHTRNFGFLQHLGTRAPTSFQDLGGGVQNPGNVFAEDGAGALVPAGNQEFRVAGFDATPSGLLQAVVLRIQYRTTAPPTDDFYRFEASVDGSFQAPGSDSATWNTIVPLVGGAGRSGIPVLAYADQPLYREVSTTVTLGTPIDGTPSLTWQHLNTLTVRCLGTEVAGADAYDVEWDVASVELYGVAPYTLLVRGDGTQGGSIQFDITGTEGAFEWTFASAGTGSVPFPPWGTFEIDLGSFWTLFKGTIGASGAHTINGVIPVDPGLSGLTVYFQSWVVDDLPTKQGALTNRASITIQ